jgi:hypothetical protein
VSERAFPVLLYAYERQRWAESGCPMSVPWSLIAPHEAQAQRNHMQTLETLAVRGGLGPCEMVAVLEDRPWRRMSDADAMKRLRELVELLQRATCGPINVDANGAPVEAV